MAEWIERVDRATNPAILYEHVLRYAFAMPAVQKCSVWADLGCGTAAAAAEADKGAFGGRLILVDNDPQALEAAKREFEAPDVAALEANLAEPDDLRRIEEELLSSGSNDDRCITCFEVVEHLDDFGPLVNRLVELAEGERCTAVLSVPNDAFSGVDNPYHATVWGEASVAELRSLLPESHVFGVQYPLTGSAIELAAQSVRRDVTAEISPERIPSHFLLAFGPRAADVGPAAGVTQLDLNEHRAWERRREADLDYYQQWADELRGPVDQTVSD